MITEKVYSNIVDNNIKKNVKNSPIWSECFKEGEQPEDVKMEYTIKFNGTIPIQVTNVKELSN